MDTVNHLRVVVASPNEVQTERNLLPVVIDEVNQNLRQDGVQLQLWRWETDTYPGFHAQGPQGLIDEILRIEDCDILIGIFWKRFGTPVYDAPSGTVHEFQRAYNAWQAQGKPHTMMYFNQRSATPQTPEEAAQWGQVLEFRRDFPKEGLWWPYRGKAQFERLVRQHLQRVVRARLTGATAPSAPSQTALASAAGLQQAYLSWVLESVRTVPLAGVDPQSIREESRRDLELAAVYTALMTQRTDARQELHTERDSRRLSALAVLNAAPRLALLGDPGSGKSTFVNFVVLCLAGERLWRADANLQVLCEPVPDEDERASRQQEPAPQPWEHGALVPLRVVLRDFVVRGLPPPGQATEVNSDTLWQFIVQELPGTLQDFAHTLRAILLDAGGLLLCDGLGEVPEAEQRRTQVKIAIERFAAAFPRLRILVTSRTYAYQQQDWKLRDFAEAVLVPFEEPHIRRFVARWYAHVGLVRGLSADDAQGRATRLSETIVHNPRLYELATRPLLLTLMASLHAWRGGTLPEKREALYADAVTLLLEQWENQKIQRLSDGRVIILEPGLLEWLQVDQQAMRQTLNRLAFTAHREQPTLTGTADIAQDTLVQALLAVQQNPDVRPARLIEYLRDRAGLLEARGVGVYAFPHRTFQEYLAACHLTDVDFPDLLVELFHAEPNRWREVVLLAGAKAVRGTTAAAWTLAETLCGEVFPDTETATVTEAWGALLAAQVLMENRSLEQIAPRNRTKVERIHGRLQQTLQHNLLPALERSQAGNALASLGDERFRADAWYLPDDVLLGFVCIPGGSFVMGSNNPDDSYLKASPQHRGTLPMYYMARYPVTVAQFRAFVEASGYAWAGADEPQGLVNHPVVYVSWHDAIAYCAWLTDCLRTWPATPPALAEILRQPGGCVTLPSEAEWEKAARGTDGRLYPWGNDEEPNRANYADTGIGTTSAVGCFTTGASVYGIEDMSGNVWEWTRSLEGNYPYPRQKAARARREYLQAGESAPRVLRGGACWDPSRGVRCAYRRRYGARLRSNLIGFRVLVVAGLL